MREQVLRPPEGEGGSRVCDQKRWESGKGRGKEGAPKMIALGFFDIGGRGLRGWAGSRGVGGRRTEEERERRHRRKKDKHRKRSRSRSREKDRDKDKDRKEKKKKSKKDKKVRATVLH